MSTTPVHEPQPEANGTDRRRAPGAASVPEDLTGTRGSHRFGRWVRGVIEARHRYMTGVLAAVAGVLVAFGSFGVLAVLAGAAGLAIGVPLDLAPQDWQQLATIISLAAAALSLLAYFFGGYVAGRLGGRDGLRHGLRVFALAVVLLGVLVLLGLGMVGPASIGTGLHSPGAAPPPGEGIRFGDVAVKAATWSLITMLLGSLAGGVLGERAHRRRHPTAPESPTNGPGPAQP